MSKLKKKTSKKSKKKEKELLKPRQIKIRIIGVGGGASSILNEMAKNLKGVSFLAADTDQRSFKKISSGIGAFQFGQELTRGWGTGMNSEIGEKAAMEVREKIKKKIQGLDLVILVSCLGGGVGSGASPVFSQVLKEAKVLSIGIFTLPFNFEGEKKMRLAKNSLKNLKDNLAGVIVLPNEEILKHSEKKASLQKSLSSMNQLLIGYFQDLIKIISLPGIINIDFADLWTILKGKNQMVYFGRGIGQGPNRVEEAIKGIFENPLFTPPSKLKKILFNISDGSNLELREIEKIAKSIFDLNPTAKIIFGISQSSKSVKKLKITLLGIGEDFSSQEKENVKEQKEKKKEKKKGKVKKKAKSKRKVKPMRKVRKSALEVKKAKKEAEERELSLVQEPEWEVPAFLRKK